MRHALGCIAGTAVILCYGGRSLLNMMKKCIATKYMDINMYKYETLDEEVN